MQRIKIVRAKIRTFRNVVSAYGQLHLTPEHDFTARKKTLPPQFQMMPLSCQPIRDSNQTILIVETIDGVDSRILWHGSKSHDAWLLQIKYRADLFSISEAPCSTLSLILKSRHKSSKSIKRKMLTSKWMQMVQALWGIAVSPFNRTLIARDKNQHESKRIRWIRIYLESGWKKNTLSSPFNIQRINVFSSADRRWLAHTKS